MSAGGEGWRRTNKEIERQILKEGPVSCQNHIVTSFLSTVKPR